MRVYSSSTGMNITPESEFELEWTKTRARTTRIQERQLVQAVLICGLALNRGGGVGQLLVV